MYPLNVKIPCFTHTGVIPAQAGIHTIVVLLQLLLLDPRLRGDDTGGKQNKVFSYPMSISMSHHRGHSGKKKEGFVCAKNI